MHKRWRIFFLGLLWAWFSGASAQVFDRSKFHTGWYPTDTTDSFRPCDKEWAVHQYFSFNAKYPESSTMLLKKVRSQYRKPPNCTQSGFVTIRFVINCEGKQGFHHLYEIDEQYQARPFDPQVVAQLLTFVKSLTDWSIANYGGQPIDYFAYFTFKIKHGEIDNLVP